MLILKCDSQNLLANGILLSNDSKSDTKYKYQNRKKLKLIWIESVN